MSKVKLRHCRSQARDEKGGGLCVRSASRPRKTNYATETQTTATQHEDLRYRPGKERMKQRNLRINVLSSKNVSRIGFWNVRTLYETKRAAQLAKEMEKFRLDIMGLSEVRCTTAGKVMLATGHTLLYSGPENEEDKHHNGVGLLLTKNAYKSLLKWEPINDRIIRARSYSKFQEVTIIQCYAPTNQADDNTNEDFYGHIQTVIDQVPKRDITIVMGDMNAKVGCNNTGKELFMAQEGVGEINENGELFTDFCGLNDLVIVGTIFAHKDIHKVTWTSPDKSVKNQIDHLAISRRWRRTLRDVRAYRGADIGSDHKCLIAQLQVKIARVRKQGDTKSPLFDITKLKTPQDKQEFSISLRNKFEALADADADSLEKKWDQVKNTFTSVCEERLGFRTKTHKTWISDKIETKRAIRQRLLQVKTREQTERANSEYRTLQKEVKKSCRQDKRTLIDHQAAEAEKVCTTK